MDGASPGPAAKITKTNTSVRYTTWTDPLGQARVIPDRCGEIHLEPS